MQIQFTITDFTTSSPREQNYALPPLEMPTFPCSSVWTNDPDDCANTTTAVVWFRMYREFIRNYFARKNAFWRDIHRLDFFPPVSLPSFLSCVCVFEHVRARECLSLVWFHGSFYAHTIFALSFFPLIRLFSFCSSCSPSSRNAKSGTNAKKKIEQHLCSMCRRYHLGAHPLLQNRVVRERTERSCLPLTQKSIDLNVRALPVRDTTHTTHPFSFYPIFKN